MAYKVEYGEVVKSELLDTYEEVLKRQESKPAITGITSGYKKLDEITGGFQKKQLTAIGSFNWKTNLALNLINNVCIEGGTKVLFYSLQHDDEEIWQRLHRVVAKTDGAEDMAFAVRKIKESNLYICDDALLNEDLIYYHTRTFFKTKKVDLIIIDDLNHLVPNTEENKEFMVSALKAMAEDFDVPVVLFCDLPRRKNKGLKMLYSDYADFRGYGNITRNIDVALTLTNGSYLQTSYRKDDPNIVDFIEVYIAKNQNGSKGYFFLRSFFSSPLKYIEGNLTYGPIVSGNECDGAPIGE